MSVNIIDLAVPVIILWELLMGLRRGLSGEIFRLAGTCLVFGIALRFYEEFGLMIARHSRLGQDVETASALAFLLILAGMGVCFFILRMVLVMIVNIKFNDAFDKPAGAMAGFINGAIAAVMLVYAAGLWPHAELRPLIREQSYAGRIVFKAVPVAKDKIRSLPLRFHPDLPDPGLEPGRKNGRNSEPRS